MSLDWLKIRYQQDETGYIVTVWFWKRLSKRWFMIPKEALKEKPHESNY
jgi:hypothetical protein